MNNSWEEFEALIERVLNGGGDETEVHRLETLLRGEAELRTAYVEQARVHAMLQWRNGAVDAAVAGCAAAARPLTRDGDSGHSRRRWAIATAALVCASVLLGIWIFGNRSLRTVARLTECQHVVWADGQQPVAPGERIPVGALQIQSGVLQLTFDCGATVVVEGPAYIEAFSAMHVRLVHGKITAHAGPEARGFAVETPETEVVDLGTEFGVEVDAAGQTGVVVFEGCVEVSKRRQGQLLQRLLKGEAIRVAHGGRLSRIVSVERMAGSSAWSTTELPDSQPVIATVRDNLRGLEGKNYYQIVRHGLAEDVAAYVDRSYQWNGVDAGGIPAELLGADLVMTFNSDKRAELEMTIHLARPANLYVFWEDQYVPPAWLTRDFVKTGLKIGLDEGPPDMPKLTLGMDAGQSIDRVFGVWKRTAPKGGAITLGPNRAKSMYGVAATPIDDANKSRHPISKSP